MASVTQNRWRSVFSFPHPVNEYSARMVATLTLLTSLLIIVFDVRWLMFFLVYSFAAHVAAGPKFSIMGRLATQFIVPKVIKRVKPVAGPPKRFAQAIGLGFSVTATVLAYGFGQIAAAKMVLGVLATFAFLEAALAFCAGCFVFGYLIRWGIIPADVCGRCADLNFPSKAQENEGV